MEGLVGTVNKDNAPSPNIVFCKLSLTPLLCGCSVTESRPGHDPAKLMPSATCLVSTAAAVTVFVKSHILHLKKTFLCPSIMLQMSPKVHLSDITPAFPFRDKEIRK